MLQLAALSLAAAVCPQPLEGAPASSRGLYGGNPPQLTLRVAAEIPGYEVPLALTRLESVELVTCEGESWTWEQDLRVDLTPSWALDVPDMGWCTATLHFSSPLRMLTSTDEGALWVEAEVPDLTVGLDEGCACVWLKGVESDDRTSTPVVVAIFESGDEDR